MCWRGAGVLCAALGSAECMATQSGQWSGAGALECWVWGVRSWWVWQTCAVLTRAKSRRQRTAQDRSQRGRGVRPVVDSGFCIGLY